MREKGLYPGVINFYVDNYETGIQAFGTVDRIETILQLLYLYVTRPDKNSQNFEDWKKLKFQNVGDLAANQFYTAVKEKTADFTLIEDLYGRKVLAGGLELTKRIEQIHLDDALNNFQFLYGNAKDLTLVVTGDFEIDTVSPVLIKYLGNFPSKISSETTCTKKTEENLPKGPILHFIPSPPKSNLKSIKYGWKFVKKAAESDDWRDQLKVELLGKLTNIRAWDLKFKKGYAIYDVMVFAGLKKNLNRYEIDSYLNLVPEQYPKVRAEFYKIFEDMKREPISKEDLNEALDYLISDRYKLDNSPGAIMIRNEMLFDHYKFDEEIVEPKEMEKFLRSVTPKDLKDLAKRIFQDKYLYEFVMAEKDQI